MYEELERQSNERYAAQLDQDFAEAEPVLTTIEEKVTPIVDGLVTDIQTVLEENAETLEQAAAELQMGLEQIKQ